VDDAQRRGSDFQFMHRKRLLMRAKTPKFFRAGKFDELVNFTRKSPRGIMTGQE
jgi:hypothetical protein